jgi:hypothetical protein
MIDPQGTLGFANGALLVTTLAAWLVALLAIVNDRNWVGGGVCLLAAAVALSALRRRV